MNRVVFQANTDMKKRRFFLLMMLMAVIQWSWLLAQVQTELPQVIPGAKPLTVEGINGQISLPE